MENYTQTYTADKLTNIKNLYPHSCHPKLTKNNLPYCLALRLRRICSKKIYFNQRAKEMQHHLLQRGYTKGYIRDAITKASSISREGALIDKTNDNQLIRVPFVVTYNPKLPSLPKILAKVEPKYKQTIFAKN